MHRKKIKSASQGDTGCPPQTPTSCNLRHHKATSGSDAVKTDRTTPMNVKSKRVAPKPVMTQRLNPKGANPQNSARVARPEGLMAASRLLKRSEFDVIRLG